MNAYADIIRRVLSGYALDPNGVHGVSHWARVYEIGSELASRNGANLRVVRLFALFHDSRRRNERIDPGHGARGAEFCAELHGALFQLSGAEFDILYRACELHTDGMTEDSDLTVRTCWDADRLDLARAGIMTDPDRLCTDAARDPDFMSRWIERSQVWYRPESLLREWGIGEGRG